jgi:hypothetical protein
MSGSGSVEGKGNYTGWIVGVGIIAGVFVVAAALWIHFHG